MILEFQKKHLSIVELSRTELPAFTVITGVNGSGKSHLLEAIENQSIKISDITQPRIVRFNYETFRLENEAVFTAHQLAAEREQAWQFHQQQVRKAAHGWRVPLGDTYNSLKQECIDENRPFWKSVGSGLEEYKNKLKGFFCQPSQKNNQHAQGIYSLAKKVPFALDDIEHDEFLTLYKPYAFKNDFLPNQLGRVFWDYYVKLRQNQINEFENEKYGKNYPFVSEVEFIRANGEKPWEVVNQILQQFDTMTYRVNSPEGTDVFTNFKLKLCHTQKPGLEIEFSSLSSGEKILMALVASVYKSIEDQHFPDVLLLDEVDASLHPSMMRNMLEVLSNIFIKHNVQVILVTHSPTTIALAPEESVFLMHPNGKDRLTKSNRQEALAILTQGFATIDEGLKLFDDLARRKLTVITEGHNVAYLKRALDIANIQSVEVLDGLEGITGKNQLKTLFDFFQKAPHDNKVIFVWDCDVSYNLTPSNNTIPYIFNQNDDNNLAKKGIENLFPTALFSNYIKRVIMSDGTAYEEFDGSRKRDFERFVLDRNESSDFQKFDHFVQTVRGLF